MIELQSLFANFVYLLLVSTYVGVVHSRYQF